MRIFARTIVLFGLIVTATVSAFAQATYDSPDTGTKLLGTYFATDIDTVSMTNGNLHVAIPVFSLPGRELPLTLTLTYDSQFYEWRNFYDPLGNPYSTYEFMGWRKASGVGGKLAASKKLQYVQYVGPYSNATLYWDLTITWVAPNGSKYTFIKIGVPQSCPGWAYSPSYGICTQGASPDDSVIYDNLTIDTTDSEFVRLSTGTHFSSGATPAYLYLKDGTTLNVSSRTTTTLNGNRLQGVANTQSTTAQGSVLADYLPTTDTTGRTYAYSNDGVTETFTMTDANGQSKIYRIIWTTVSAYDPQHYPIALNSSFRVVQSIQLPNGRSYSFEYNGHGFLSKVTLPSGAYIRYSYSRFGGSMLREHVAARIVSPDGAVASEQQTSYGFSYTLDSIGDRVLPLVSSATTDPTGAQTTTNFTNNLSTVITTTSGGNTLKTIQRTWSGAPNARVQSENTTVGTMVRQVTTSYDTYNNVTSQVFYDWGNGSPGGFIRSMGRTYAGSPYTDNHILNRVSSEKIYNNVGLVAETDYEYDNYTAQPLVGRGGTIPGWADPGSSTRANSTAVKRWLNTNNTWLVTGQQYDVLGNLVKTTDPAGHVTNIDFTDCFYSSSPGVCNAAPTTPVYATFAYATNVTDVTGFSARSRYDFNTGLVRDTTDGLLRTTTKTYDILNRETLTTNPNGGFTRYTFNDTALTAKKEVKVSTAGNPSADVLGTVIAHYDGLYRETQKETYDPEGTIFVDTQYDAKGRKWKVSNPRRGTETAVWTVFTYDGTDRPLATTAPDGSVVQYAYTNNQTTVTDQAGNPRRYTYDGVGHLVQVEEPNPTLSSPMVTTYADNAIDKMVQPNQSGNVRTWLSDSLGRLTSQTLPESGGTMFTYNTDSLLATKSDARSIVTTTNYGTSGGNIHQVVTRSYSDGTPAVSFSYNAQGLRTSVTDGLGSVTYGYDSNTDRLTQESRTLTGVTGTFTTGYSYNIKGDLTSMTYPSGRVVNFNYATGGGCCNSRLSSVFDQITNTTINSVPNYNAAGEILANTLGNGVTQSYTYNNRLQQTGLTASLSGTSLMNFAYNYGTSSTNTGRVLARTDNIQQEHSVQYQYDSIYRLSQVFSNDTLWNISWTFDIWGNRLMQTPQGLAASTTPPKVGTQTLGYTNNRNTLYSYDAAGNQINDGLHNYTFNAENQIASMDGGAATYAYDGEGRRMKKTAGPETTYYFYGSGGIISEFTTSSAISTATVAANSDKSFYHMTDKLGSAVLVMMNTSGVVIENNRTLPYGEAWLPTDNGQPSTNDKKFTTYQRDAESGLDYAMNRYFANTNGRFQSVDSGPLYLRRPATLNRYVYAMDDPINQIDAKGLSAAYVCGRAPNEDPLYCENEEIPYSEEEQGKKDPTDLYEEALKAIQEAKDDIFKRLLNGGFGPDCDKALSAVGTNMAALINQMAKTPFYNGVNNPNSLTQVLTGYTPFPSLTTLPPLVSVGQLFSTFQPQAMAAPGQGVIYIDPVAWLSGDTKWNAATLLHELIHMVTWKPDQILQPQLGLSVLENSGNITQKIKDDCFKNYNPK